MKKQRETGTEEESRYQSLEKMSVRDLLTGINREDRKVPVAVGRAIPQIEKLVNVIIRKMKKDGRLFYIGSGTSGRLGIVDASEIPPTYGMPFDRVIGIISGGDRAIRKAVEHAEDDPRQAWIDLQKHEIGKQDVLIGIAASGRTPYVIGGIEDANRNGVTTGCITCNTGTELARISDYPVEVVPGPEFVTGSTRMKAGTAQKLVLNMVSTAVMIRLGRVKGNKMVDMQLTNIKLIRRGVRFIREETGIDAATAEKLLLLHRSVRKAIDVWKKKS